MVIHDPSVIEVISLSKTQVTEQVDQISCSADKEPYQDKDTHKESYHNVYMPELQPGFCLDVMG